ncbi:hypothetical protein AKJ09_11241 [Labilithrix luteola]|uniref:Uncharacterized protein n=1 Tax=Labilithrix luteola TaxID=1391654 RepID=A0A0K1QFS6_9BACT|nr:hypothetical protein [Labilithrix luteola]AKV04578.1 hypothetical protein AKJ09_11241 [Labilithrix luteola]
MRAYVVSLSSIVLASTFIVRDAHAGCSTDIDCDGDRVCVDRACAEPQAHSAVSSSSMADDSTAWSSSAVEAPRTVRRSTPLMVTGIVALALVPVAVALTISVAHEKNVCKSQGTSDWPVFCPGYDAAIYGGAIGSAVLAAGGLAMLLVGVRRVPVEPPRNAMRLTPWYTGSNGGLMWTGSF